MHQCGDRVVAACGFTLRAAGRVGRARLQGSGVAGSTRQGPSVAQTQANRLPGFLSSTVMQAPHPRLIDLGIPKFLQSCAASLLLTPSSPRDFVLVHLEQSLMHGRVNAGGDEGLDLHTFLGQEMLIVPITIVGVMPRACLTGWAGPA